uniref:Uncharacterized protein n=1 Tax=Globodera rostochiensis TaxID=31243 RepID=A0A914I4E2_GLORO
MWRSIISVHLPFRHASARSIVVGIAPHATDGANLAEIQSQPPTISKEASKLKQKMGGRMIRRWEEG